MANLPQQESVTRALDITTFYNELSSIVWHIPKHNILIIDGDMNAHTGKDRNPKFNRVER